MFSAVNNKALSEVIAVAFMILLAILSIVIVWASVRPIITNLAPEVNCAETRIKMPIEIINACYNTETRDVEVKLMRKISDSTNIKTIEFTLSGKEDINYRCGQNCDSATILKPGQTKTYYFATNDEKAKTTTSVVFGINDCILESKKLKEDCN